MTRINEFARIETSILENQNISPYGSVGMRRTPASQYIRSSVDQITRFWYLVPDILVC